MMRVVLLTFAALLLVLPATAALTPGKLEINTVPTTTHGNRFFLSYFPASLKNSTSAPVAMVFHQMGQSCFELMTSDTAAHLTQTAEERQVLVIAPCGLTSKTGVSWNSGVCCGWNDDSNAPNDVVFAQTVLSIVQNLTTVNTAKVAAMGMGNGAFMAQMLGCLAPTSFRFVATIAGIVTLSPGNMKGQQECTDLLILQGSARPRILLLQGDQDGVVGWAGSPVVHLVTPIENFVAWGTRNGCVTGQTGYPMDQWSNAVFESRIYNASCLGGASVEMVRWWGGGHAWPTQAANNFDATTYFFNSLNSL